MAKAVKTAGQLREFLVETMLAVRDGSLDADAARTVTKIAAQVNESFYTEAMITKTRKELAGEDAQPLGALAIGGEPTQRHVPTLTVIAPAPEPITDEELNEARNMLAGGTELDEVAEYIGCDVTQLQVALDGQKRAA